MHTFNNKIIKCSGFSGHVAKITLKGNLAKVKRETGHFFILATRPLYTTPIYNNYVGLQLSHTQIKYVLEESDKMNIIKQPLFNLKITLLSCAGSVTI